MEKGSTYWTFSRVIKASASAVSVPLFSKEFFRKIKNLKKGTERWTDYKIVNGI